VVLGNSPSISSISITPNSNVVTGTALLCQATAFDPNDGTLSPSYSWTVQGNVVSNTSSFTVSATNSNPTDTVTCTATATDSDGNVATSSATVTIQNTAPTLSGIAVSPSPVYNDSLAVCSATVYDPDENPTNNLAINYTWSDSGGVLFTGNPFDLQTATLLPGDSLTCSASSTDNQGQNATQNTNVSISNRSPTIPTVSITWGGFAVNPLPNDTLTCSASTVSDPDGQSVSYTYSWTSATGQTATGATLAGSNVASGDNWTCTVAVSDGISTVSASANIDVGSVIPPGCNITNCDNSLDLGNGLYLDMITIYAGTFNMGSPSTETGRGSHDDHRSEPRYVRGFVGLPSTHW
jgi:hypothetical protein